MYTNTPFIRDEIITVLKEKKTSNKSTGPDGFRGKFYQTLAAAAAAAKSLQLCPTLCDPVDGSPSGSPVPGILQTRTLEWVAMSFSNA